VSADARIIVAHAAHASELAATVVVTCAGLIAALECSDAWSKERSHEKQSNHKTATRHSSRSNSRD
jgi:hypothetical protein